MAKYIKTPAYVDRMPVDLSFVFASEKPAGVHGFVKADGEDFRFEDGTLAKFWGVNFNGGANFPEHDYAEKVARRLAQAGCNLVRLHQMDSQWNTPNLYAFTKGKRVTTTRVLDEESMDRLDYLIYCLKKEGIYCTMAMINYRKFKVGDDVPHYNELNECAKPYLIFNRRLIELQKEFCDQIWNRVNKYTGLAYKDDPVFCFIEIANEADLCGKPKKALCPYYEEEFRQLYKAWLEKNGKEDDWENRDMYAAEQPVMDFKMELSLQYHAEMRDYMRSIGVKVPITGTNWSNGSPCNTLTERDMDFCANHHYYYDWRWSETEKCCGNFQVNGYPYIMPATPYMRLNNKPFFISEWDMPWPNCYRAEGPIYYAAMCALQNWGGMAVHCYSYTSLLEHMDILGKEVSTSTIGGIAYREGIFSTWNDPAKFGLFYHAALIVRRGDISPAEKKIGITYPQLVKRKLEAFKDIGEQHRIGVIVDGIDAEGCETVISSDERMPHPDPKVIRSDNGQMWRDLKQKLGGIDTDRTKIVYGKLSAGKFDNPKDVGNTSVRGMGIKAKSDFGVIALSSLTDDPIKTSDNMLLSCISRARNTDAIFDGDKMVEVGHAPIVSEVVEATIAIETDRTDLHVWGVNAEGFYVGEVPATFEDGVMTFTVGEKFPALHYLIVAE